MWDPSRGRATAASEEGFTQEAETVTPGLLMQRVAVGKLPTAVHLSSQAYV